MLNKVFDRFAITRKKRLGNNQKRFTLTRRRKVEHLERRDLFATDIVNTTFDDPAPYGFDAIYSSKEASGMVQRTGTENEFRTTYTKDESSVLLFNEIKTRAIFVSFDSRYADLPPIDNAQRGYVGLKQSRLTVTGNGREGIASMQHEIHFGQPGYFGPGYVAANRTFISNQWAGEIVDNQDFDRPLTEKYSVKYFAKLNTPGKSDGIFIVWFNNEIVGAHRNVNWTDAPDAFFSSVWVGGNVSFGGHDPSRPVTRFIDNVKITVDADDPTLPQPPTPALPSIAIGDSSIVEGNSGTRAMRFPVTLSKAASSVVTTRFATVPGTATAADFIMRSGTLTIPAGLTNGFIDISIVGETLFEANEFFEVRLSDPIGAKIADGVGLGRIINDDVMAQLAIDDTSLFEGDHVTQLASFNVRLNVPSPVDVFADFTTSSGTATQGSDFARTTGTVRIPAGSTVASIRVPVFGDTRDEKNETFSLRLSNVRGAILARATALGTILNDDRHLTVFRVREGNWYDRNIATGATRVTQWGLPGDVPLNGDFDGDGITDQAIWRPATGTWFVRQSTGGTAAVQWGLAQDIPVPGDYDGDGRTDFALWHQATGYWRIRYATGGELHRQWGLPGDRPINQDFDGDGRTDLAVWRPSNGMWYIIPSSTPSAPIVRQWGLPGDIPVASDFDRDGRADVAVWRPTTGTWFVVGSAMNQVFVQQWGLPGDIPQPIDVDGDGHVDFSVWRPEIGMWFTRSFASGQIQTRQWGLMGDIPTANAHVANLSRMG